jgi:hypothetical protein
MRNKIFINLTSIVFLTVITILSPQTTSAKTQDKQSVPQTNAIGNIITDDYLYLLTQHLYRWYMDESDILNNRNKDYFTFWINPVSQTLDTNDKSKMLQIILPDFNISVLAKKSDYTIDELNISVSNNTYRIAKVSRISPITAKPADAISKVILYPAMKQYLFTIRNDVQFPNETLLQHLAKAVREQLHEDARKNNDPLPGGEQLVYLSPLSPLANELWVFWETGRLLLHFSSDLDLTDPDLWKIDQLAVDSYDVDEQVVVSLEEAPGSNAYLTRDQVGRALYNCIILGKRIIIPPKKT